MVNNPAIVVSAFNRPSSLIRLLKSLASAKYPNTEVKLIISIDKSEVQQVAQVAENFLWKHGQKEIICRSSHLGLKSHILTCGDLAQEYGAIIMLEDDLLVSPHFYFFALQSLSFYASANEVAGISLYGYKVAESCFYPFEPIDDGSDCYFMQVASSWGQIWTSEQWLGFRAWLKTNPILAKRNNIPSYIHNWGEHSWKKHFIQYLIENKKYFVFPRVSLSTNFEEPGTNAASEKVFQVPLQVGERGYRFLHLGESRAVYDAWFEIEPECLNKWNESLRGFDYTVDLYGTKNTDSITTKAVLTLKNGQSALLSFSDELLPLENNVALNLPGTKIALREVANNVFVPVQTKARYLLDQRAAIYNSNISVIITVTQTNTEAFIATLKSINKMNNALVECVIVVYESVLNEIKTYLTAFAISPIVVSNNTSINGMIDEGLKGCSNDVITWIKQGTLFAEHTVFYVKAIFDTFKTLNWVSGVSSQLHVDIVDKGVSLRINGNDAYQDIQNGQPLRSMELHFFKKSIIERGGSGESLHEFFLKLLSNYQLIVVEEPFGKLSDSNSSENIDLTHKNYLLHNYKYLKTESTVTWNFWNYILRKLFKYKLPGGWLYPYLNKYPDVLRFDNRNKSFYFSKS